ncbi:MAG: AMP-binding protein [Firmicutes bacterium]|nr:AMP-binding protein [Bacillota bacterium]
MKLCFSTKNVDRDSFLGLCRTAHEYGFAGFEIWDPAEERTRHEDSILRSGSGHDARRKLRNRGLEVPALRCPVDMGDAGAGEALMQCVDLAARSGIGSVIIRAEKDPGENALDAVIRPAVDLAQRSGTILLFETCGWLSDTSRLVGLIRSFGSASIAAAWNMRETFFDAKETPEETIRNLGAYIRYVRLGDRRDGRDVLIGEGDLPAQEFIEALTSLNYEGYVCAGWNEETADEDIVLTHFASFFADKTTEERSKDPLQHNRSGSGTFPWPKYRLLDITFPRLLDVLAQTYPDQYAFKYTTLDYTRTYSQFRDDVDAVARGLIAMGVEPGHHVAVWATNVPEWFLTFWAAVRIGAVLVTVNSEYRSHEIEYLLRQSDTHTLIMIDGYKGISYRDIISGLCPELSGLEGGRALYSAALPFLRRVVTCGFDMPGGVSWQEMIEKGKSVPMEEVRRRASSVRPGDVCNMQYTSGTTGFPKGVMLTHSNIINDGKTIGDRMDLSTADRMMIQVPMFHCFGMVLSMTSMMTHGGTLCPMPYFSPRSSLACIDKEKITCFNGVPTMFIAMFGCDEMKTTDFSFMRTGIMAGANCPPELMKRAAREMNMTEILSVYGMTESSPGCTMGEVSESLELRTETVGSAFPGVECRIIDPETGEELPDGENGEFVARGFNIMKGYYKMPRATKQAIDREGWLHSGDICCRTPEGYYRVTGRLKDMIIRGGENIYPREIEEFFLGHPAVRDVQVVGVPDRQYGEEACAWIILKDGAQATEEELRTYAKERIARHKIPRYFLFVSEFPMNAAGKILKYKMREASEDLLGIKP